MAAAAAARHDPRLRIRATAPPEVDPKHATVHDVYRELLYQREEIGGINERLDVGATELAQHATAIADMQQHALIATAEAAGATRARSPYLRAALWGGGIIGAVMLGSLASALTPLAWRAVATVLAAHAASP